VVLRYTLIIAMAYLLLVEHGFSSTPSVLLLLIVAALASNVLIGRLPPRITNSTGFNSCIVVGDTVWITVALLYSGVFGAEFFYLYFFVLLVAAIGENLGLIVVGVIAVCIGYIFVSYATGGTSWLWSSQLLIRIPFLFTAGAFYGHLVNRVRREQQRASEEAHAVTRLEKIQQELAEYSSQLEQANMNLEREIAERKRAEAAFQQARDQLRAVLDAVPASVSWISSDLKYLGVNRHLAALYKFVPEAFVGREIGFLKTSPEFTEYVGQFFTSPATEASQEIMTEIDGSLRSFLIIARKYSQGHAAVFAGIDIDGRKRAEETLRIIVEGTSPTIGGDFFRSLVRHLAVTLQIRFAFVSELVDEQGKRVRTLAFWKGKDFGENFEYDTKGTPCENVIIGKEVSYYPKGVQKLFPEDPWLAEARVESYMGIPFFSLSGKVIGHMGVMDDKPMGEEHRIKSILRIFATRVGVELERKRAEEELRATQLQLMQSGKLESVGRLAAGVAHEVKNPLAIIQQGTAYLSQTSFATDDDTVAQVLKKMENAVNRADGVVRGLLDFSAPTSIEVRPAELNAVVEQSLLLVKHELVKAHVSVVKVLGENLPLLKLDRHKIEQVFVNLFMNAIQAMPEGGMLTVKTATKQLTQLGSDVDRGKTDGFRIGETLVVVEVEDTGTGIPDKELARVFDPFFTTKRTSQGTGLGLSVTRKIIELHRGMIDISNRQEGGVRVALMFKTDGGHVDAEETNPAH
jgi:signal transduction histidine kinase